MTTNINAIPPVVDPTTAIKTLDDLTAIIRSLHHRPVMDLTHTNYDAYLQTLVNQVNELEELESLYRDANQWVHFCNNASWHPRAVGLARELCSKGIMSPSKLEVNSNVIVCTWTYATGDANVGVVILFSITDELLYGDWMFMPGVTDGFSYKPYTDSLLQTYFHSGMDTVTVWRLVESMQRK